MVNEQEVFEADLVPTCYQDIPDGASRQFLDALNQLRGFLEGHDLDTPSAKLLDRIETLHHAEVVFAHFVDREGEKKPARDRVEYPALQSMARVISQLDAELRETTKDFPAPKAGEAVPAHWTWQVITGALTAAVVMLMWRGFL